MSLKQFADTLPEYAKDLRLNLGSILSDQLVGEERKLGLLLACAHGSGYRPLAATTDRVVAFERHGEDAAGSVVTVAARLPLSIGDAADATVGLPDGSWTDVLSGESYAGPARVGALLASLPVALLVRVGG